MGIHEKHDKKVDCYGFRCKWNIFISAKNDISELNFILIVVRMIFIYDDDGDR